MNVDDFSELVAFVCCWFVCCCCLDSCDVSRIVSVGRVVTRRARGRRFLVQIDDDTIFHLCAPTPAGNNGTKTTTTTRQTQTTKKHETRNTTKTTKTMKHQTK
jgi:hypothetical protein